MKKETLAKLMKYMPPEELPSGNIRTGPVRLAYVSVFERPKKRNGEDGKYTATLLFPPGSDMSILENAVEATAADEFGNKWKSKRLRLPFREGDEDGFAEKPGYGPGVKWFRAGANYQPEVVDRKGRPIHDPATLYPGCWAIVTVRPFAYRGDDGDGISFGLQNVAFLTDDERLAGGRGSSAAEDFGGIERMDDVEALLAAEEAEHEADDLYEDVEL